MGASEGEERPPDGLLGMSATELAEGVRARRFSAQDVVSAHLQRIESGS